MISLKNYKIKMSKMINNLRMNKLIKNQIII